MTRTILFLIFGLAGIALLVSLGVWQMQRLAWKEGILAEIEARIAAPPVALPLDADAEADKYLPVEMTGQFGAGVLRVLVSQKHVGAGYRLITPFETGGRTVLVDRGFIRVSAEMPPAPAGQVTVTGNLHWPDDRNSSTPENDVEGNTWFARDIDQMSELFGAEPLLVVARDLSQSGGAVTPLPVDTSAIPNDHLQYAVTWFGLAAVWAVMMGYFLFRLRTPAEGDA
ncbi:MAG: SURF1 family protein [Pseudomonadota bacterium]